MIQSVKRFSGEVSLLFFCFSTLNLSFNFLSLDFFSLFYVFLVPNFLCIFIYTFLSTTAAKIIHRDKKIWRNSFMIHILYEEMREYLVV